MPIPHQPFHAPLLLIVEIDFESMKLSFHSMLTRSIEGKVEELYTFGRQHVRLWSRALGTAKRGATPTGIVLEPATKDR